MPPSTRPTPPLVSDCLERPQGQYPHEPEAPAAGESITDTYLRALKAWGNSVLGIATKDREAWHGERRCIRGKAKAGAIR
jgi:hypothetical protein